MSTGLTLGYVYFLLDPDVDEVKIGFSCNVDARIKQIIYIEKRPRAKLIGRIRAFWWAERVMHLRFWYLCRHGEWFEMRPEIASVINESGVESKARREIFDGGDNHYSIKNKLYIPEYFGWVSRLLDDSRRESFQTSNQEQISGTV